jgi:hypothetical protein
MAMVNALCTFKLDLMVTDFNGAGDGVHGTIDFVGCLSLSHPQIRTGRAVVTGTATGTPENVTVCEADDITWYDGQGHPVASSTAKLVRRFIGPPGQLVEVGVIIVTDNPLGGGQHATLVPAGATRFAVSGGYRYLNDGGCDYK